MPCSVSPLPSITSDINIRAAQIAPSKRARAPHRGISRHLKQIPGRPSPPPLRSRAQTSLVEPSMGEQGTGWACWAKRRTRRARFHLPAWFAADAAPNYKRPDCRIRRGFESLNSVIGSSLPLRGRSCLWEVVKRAIWLIAVFARIQGHRPAMGRTNSHFDEQADRNAYRMN